MRSEHRAPLIAALVVVVACGGVLLHAARTDALGGLGRPMRVLAAHLLEPAPPAEPAERAERSVADPPMVQGPAAEAAASGAVVKVAASQRPQRSRVSVESPGGVTGDRDEVERTRPEPDAGRTDPDRTHPGDRGRDTEHRERHGHRHEGGHGPGRERSEERRSTRGPERGQDRGHGQERAEERRDARGPEHGHGHGNDRGHSHDRGHSGRGHGR